MFSLDEFYGSNIARLIDLLNLLDFPYENIKININHANIGIDKNLQYVIENCDTDFCIILRNNDAFLDCNSLQNIIDELDSYEKGGMFPNISSGIICIDNDGNFIRNSNDTLVFSCNHPNLSRNVTFQSAFVRRLDSQVHPVSNNKYDLSNLQISLSDLRFYNDFKSHLPLGYLKRCKMIDSTVSGLINNNRGSLWGITDSTKYLLNLLNGLKSPFVFPKINFRKQIKMVFFIMEFSTFPSVQGVYEAANSDPRFTADLVYVPFQHINKSGSDELEMAVYSTHGYKVIPHCQYDILQESPDVAFFIKPYDCVPAKFYIAEIYKVIRYSIFIRYCPDNIDVNYSSFFEKTAFRSSLSFLAWRNYFSSRAMLKNAIEHSWNNGENFHLAPSPRYDINIPLVFKTFQIETSTILSKANGRKIILINSNHQVKSGDRLGTFDVLGMSLLSEISKRKNIFFIWRPHPLFWKAIKSIFSESQMEEIQQTISHSTNIMIDRFDSYLPSFHLSDALISDMSSLVGEYLVTKKPIALMVNESAINIYPEQYLQALYTAIDINGLLQFLNDFSLGLDMKKAERIEMANFYFSLPNNRISASQQILNDIAETLL